VHGRHARDLGDVERLADHRVVGDRDPQLLAAALQPARELEEQPQPGAVQEVRALEVDHQPERVVGHGARDPLAELGDVGEVDLAGDPGHRDPVALGDRERRQLTGHRALPAFSRRRSRTSVPRSWGTTSAESIMR